MTCERGQMKARGVEVCVRGDAMRRRVASVGIVAGLVALTGCAAGPGAYGDDAAAWEGPDDWDVSVDQGSGSGDETSAEATAALRPHEWEPGASHPQPWWGFSGGAGGEVDTGSGLGVDTGAGPGDVGGSGSTAETGVPFGFWGLDGYLSASGLEDVEGRFGATVFQGFSADPDWAVGTLLPMAEAAGMTVTLRMTGGPSYYTTDGSFDIDKWKAMLDPWVGSGVQEYIDNGTLVGHMILDDINNYEVRDPTAADLDELARYSKEQLPGLMTFVRKQASELPVPDGGTYSYLDAAVNQYKASEGDVTTYAEAERDAAVSLGLGVINGLNLANGGDGSSGQQGWGGSGTYAMSAAEIMTYGAVLVAVPECGMILNWEYDGEERWPDGTVGADYLDGSDVQAALAAVAREAAAHDKVELLRP